MSFHSHIWLFLLVQHTKVVILETNHPKISFFLGKVIPLPLKRKGKVMRIIGNLLWWLFGGLEAAFGYFTGHVMKFNEQVSGAIESFPIDNLTMK